MSSRISNYLVEKLLKFFLVAVRLYTRGTITHYIVTTVTGSVFP